MAASKSPFMRLCHIRDEIAQLLPLLVEVNYQTFASSFLLLRVTERSLLIISEAAKSLPTELTDRYPEVDWSAIRGIGNVLRHEYEAVQAEVLWDVVNNDLPELGLVIEKMLGEMDP
jgi:uncharacterized protein with HEPN domain